MRNCLLIFLIREIFKRTKFLFVKRDINVEDKIIAIIIERYIVVKI